MLTKPTAKGFKIIGTNIMVRKREGTKNWEVCIYFPKIRKYKIYSSHTDNFDEAVKFALEKQGELNFMTKHNIEIFKKSMGKVAEEWIAFISSDAESKYRKQNTTRVFRSVVKYHIEPFFRNDSLGNITTERLRDYAAYMIAKKITAKTTVNYHNMAIRNILQWAKSKGWYKKDELPKLQLPEDAPDSGETRASFSEHEVGLLVNNFDNYIEHFRGRKLGAKKIEQCIYNAKILKAFIFFMLGTGCRTNDIKLVKWSDIKQHFKSDHSIVNDAPLPHIAHLMEGGDMKEYFTETILKAWLTGKGRERWAPISQQITHVLTWWWTESINNNDDDLIFAGRNGTFNSNYCKWFQDYLEFLEIPYETEDGVRTPYSLRHTFITRRLAEGVSPFDLEHQCGTSVKHIQETYSHMIAPELYEKIFKAKPPC